MTEQESLLLDEVLDALYEVQNLCGSTAPDRRSLLEQALGMKTTYTEHFFDNRTYPASWKRADNAVNALLKKIKEQIARQWVEGYLKPELEHFGREVTLETVKENLHLKGKRDALLYDEKEQVSQYLTQKMTALGISPDFRYIEPEHFAVILKAYYEFLKECEGLNQAHVAALFGIKGDQSTFSKYLKLNNMKKVSIQAENNILRSLLRYFMDTGDMSPHARLEVGQIYVPCFRNGFHAELFQNNRFFAGYYLVNLLKIRQITFSNGHEPFTIPEVNGILCDRQLLTVGEHVWLENCAAPGDALQSFLRKQDPGYVRSTVNSFLNSLIMCFSFKPFFFKDPNSLTVLFCKCCSKVPGNHHIYVVLIRTDLRYHIGILYVEIFIKKMFHQHSNSKSYCIGFL
jgi:hypothetical protein